MFQKGAYREGRERFVPSPSEAVLLAALVLFCWQLYGGTENDAIAGLSSVVVVAIAWVLGVALRAGMNDMRYWLVIGGVLALLAPWLALNTFQLGLMTQTAVFALIIFGLNIVTGYTGQISLGHGALVGLSAYTMAILISYSGWPLVPAMLVAVLVTTIFGFALGIPALRLAGPYLAIATLAAALIFPLVIKLDSLAEYTGGVQGLRLEQPAPPGFLGDFFTGTASAEAYTNDFQKRRFAESAYIYYLVMLPAVVGLLALWNLGRSRFGRAFVAIRDGEVAATSMGVNVALYKIMAFGISAIFAGVAGVLFYLAIAFVASESFDVINLSINPLAYLVIGGLASTGGPVIGAIGYKWVPEIIAKIARRDADFDLLQGAMTGLILIIVMTRLPQGIWGAVVRINRFSWPGLLAQSRAWTAARTLLFWVGAGVGLAAIVLIAVFIGAVWAVFAAGLVLVAPQDAWYGAYNIIRHPLHRGREPETEIQQPNESIVVDTT